MASVWVFGCELGLSQDACAEREFDPDSRGATSHGGCCSCIHRIPANAATRDEEAAWANREVPAFLLHPGSGPSAL